MLSVFSYVYSGTSTVLGRPETLGRDPQRDLGRDPGIDTTLGLVQVRGKMCGRWCPSIFYYWQAVRYVFAGFWEDDEFNTDFFSSPTPQQPLPQAHTSYQLAYQVVPP